MIELACPESCHYLRSAREQAGPREAALRAREMQAEGKSISDINERILAITFTIEKAIIESQRATEGPSLHDLDDSEALAAVENTIKNLETEESGLIYEHRAQSPRVQQVSQRIREGLEKLSAELMAEERPTRSETMRALRFVRDNIESHLRRASGEPRSRGFIRHSALFFPWPEQVSKPLIITG
jgi:hypothetical protein